MCIGARTNIRPDRSEHIDSRQMELAAGLPDTRHGSLDRLLRLRLIPAETALLAGLINADSAPDDSHCVSQTKKCCKIQTWRLCINDGQDFTCRALPVQPYFTFTARHYASAVYMLWPCVCLSVTSRCSTKTAKRRIIQTTPLDSTGTSFLMPNISAKFDRGQPLRGRQMQVGGLKSATFDK